MDSQWYDDSPTQSTAPRLGAAVAVRDTARDTGIVLVLALTVSAGSVVALMVLTGLGERKRGARVVTAVVAGLFFPLAWAAWYVRDERPYAAPRPDA